MATVLSNVLICSAQTSVARDGAKREPQNSAEWRRATKAECDAEIERQYKWMAEVGVCCDPPISLGMGVYTYDEKSGHLEGYSQTPCGYVKISDPRQYRTMYSVYRNGQIIETMDEEWFNRAVCRNITEVAFLDENGRKLSKPVERRISPKPEWTECKK